MYTSESTCILVSLHVYAKTPVYSILVSLHVYAKTPVYSILVSLHVYAKTPGLVHFTSTWGIRSYVYINYYQGRIYMPLIL